MLDLIVSLDSEVKRIHQVRKYFDFHRRFKQRWTESLDDDLLWTWARTAEPLPSGRKHGNKRYGTEGVTIIAGESSPLFTSNMIPGSVADRSTASTRTPARGKKRSRLLNPLFHSSRITIHDGRVRSN